MIRVVLAFAAVMSVLTVPAAAQPTDAQIDAVKSNCRSDFLSNCRGVKRGGSEALQCLKEHQASLSGSCKAAVSALTPAPPPAAAKPAPAPAPVAAPAPAPVASPPAAATRPAAPPPAAVAKPAEPLPAAKPVVATPAPSAAAKPSAAKPAPAPKASPKTASPQTKAKPVVATAPPAAENASPSAAPSAAPAAPPRALTFKDVALVRRTCMADIGLHCKGIKPGDRRIVECLEAQGDALLPVCKQAVAKTRQ